MRRCAKLGAKDSAWKPQLGGERSERHHLPRPMCCEEALMYQFQAFDVHKQATDQGDSLDS